ncbi:hypothetical protein LJR098_000193 [Rhizobium sp. LjRoot98]|uniref:hypothetical protein n=1 Tax=unclassified Rhizobium TaxID=2613769 RepID=UPI0007135B0E|nr:MULTISPECIES: hypothetical protein [unclassified Rhizobium]KQV40725.1 hypothetical protein ASC96_19870 [Rhizobium sp. Root1204]KQY17152.1 hypothetical protein ASD36_00350 [Rhizobium sp. Root1334]KRC13049.1 hypothetical protein ASE23_00345 [Rhizobium sp. Root73]
MTAMLVRTVVFSLATLASGAMVSGATAAKASDHLNYGMAHVSDACGSPGVLDFITSGFGSRAADYLKMDIAIAEIRDTRQKRIELRDKTRPVQREYCRATAITSDGEKRALWYLIERDFGFAGIGSNIEFCLSGLDPWYVYGAQCASLR